jgi:hypothetical protein
MPTGYTSGVATGEIKDFKTYALQCARAFGACIMLRDEPMSDEIPEFKPSDHYEQSLAKAQAELAAFMVMNREEKEALYRKECDDRIDYAKKRIAENAAQKQRYEDMLKQAREFRAPTSGHNEYAKFLVTQLEESIKFDCSGDFYEKQLERPSFSEWAKGKLEKLKWDIEYSEKHHREEVKRTASRNKWVADLKKSLGVE